MFEARAKQGEPERSFFSVCSLIILRFSDVGARQRSWKRFWLVNRSWWLERASSVAGTPGQPSSVFLRKGFLCVGGSAPGPPHLLHLPGSLPCAAHTTHPLARHHRAHTQLPQPDLSCELTVREEKHDSTSSFPSCTLKLCWVWWNPVIYRLKTNRTVDIINSDNCTMQHCAINQRWARRLTLKKTQIRLALWFASCAP